MTPVAVPTSRDDLGLPAEQRGGLGQRLRHRAGPDDHQLGDGPQHGDHRVVDGDGVAHPAAEHLRRAARRPPRSSRSRTASCPTTSSPSRRVTRQTGSRATSSSHSSAGRLVAGTSRQRAVPPRGRPATSASIVTDAQIDRRPLAVPRLARSASWSSRAPDRSEPTRPPPGVIASASVAIARTEPLRLDHPRHVHPGAGTQAGRDAERDPVHARSVGVPLPPGHTRPARWSSLLLVRWAALARSGSLCGREIFASRRGAPGCRLGAVGGRAALHDRRALLRIAPARRRRCRGTHL